MPDPSYRSSRALKTWLRRVLAISFAALVLVLVLGLGPGSDGRLGSSAWAQDAHLPEAARWLQGYLRIDTTNPPGNERKGAEYLARILHREGIETQLLGVEDGRASLYARLRSGRPNAEAVLLLHHIDVVPAGSGWTVEPFAGVVRDGRLWGRGAVDTKGLGVAELAAFVALKRSRIPLARDVILLAVADEESGGEKGTSWLLDHYPQLFEGVTAVINEGGSNRGIQGRLLWWGVEVSQKRPLWLEVDAHGRGGHGSGLNPGSANHRLILALSRLLEAPPRWRVSPPVKEYLEALAPHQNEHFRRLFLRIDQVIAEDGPREPLFPGLANLFLDSVQVTVLEGGDRINVVAPSARALLDIRLLPDTDAEAFLERVRELVGREVDVRVVLSSPPSAPSTVDHPLYRIAARVLGEEAPVVPSFIAGFTDSRYYRQRGIAAYGILPFALEVDDLRGIHGADERLPLVELERGVERLRRIVEAFGRGHDG